LAREPEHTVVTIRQWIKQAALDDGLGSDGLTSDERQKRDRLLRENWGLREECEILAKVAAWFAHETGTTPSRHSHSYGLTKPASDLDPVSRKAMVPELTGFSLRSMKRNFTTSIAPLRELSPCPGARPRRRGLLPLLEHEQ
jgi:hypothetical protein